MLTLPPRLLVASGLLLSTLGVATPVAAVCAGPRLVYDYPVVLKGPPVLYGVNVRHLQAWAWRDAQWRQVPLQVEELNTLGDYVLEGGLPFTKGTDDGLFDANDEVAVDGAALGDDFAPAEVPPAVTVGVVRSWKLSLCKDGKSAGYLLVQALSKPPTGEWGDPAVRFHQATSEIETAYYRYRFNPKSPALLGEVLLKRDGVESPVIRDSKFLMPLRTPFWMPDMTFKDSDFTSTIESWQTGPVRTIVAVGVKYSAFLALFKLHLFSELVFYKNRFVIPTVIEFVFDPSSHLKAGSGIAYSLRFPEGRGWQITSNLTPLPAASPQDVVESGRTAAETEVFTARGHGPDGAFLAQVRVDAKARAMVPPPFLMRAAEFRSPGHLKHWPWLEELPGDLGVFLDFSRLTKGTYAFGLDLLLSPRSAETFADYGTVEATFNNL